jgi:uncharacterized protein (TIRG00374 family)
MKKLSEFLGRNFGEGNIRGWVIIIGSLVLLAVTISKSGINVYDLSVTKRQFGYWLLAVCFFLAAIYVHSIRVKTLWSTCLPKSRKLYTLEGLLLCNFYSGILPGNAGELVRTWHFSRRNNVSFIRSLSSQGVEKYIDAWGFTLNAVVMLFLFDVSYDHYAHFVFLLGIIISILFLYLLLIFNRNLESLAARMLFKFKKTGKALYKWYYHTKLILTKMPISSFCKYIFWAYLMFGLNVLQFYFVLKASGLTPPMLSWQTACWIAMSVIIIFVVPSAPGNIGVMHYGIFSILVFVAKHYGLQTEQNMLKDFARTAIYLHLSYFVPEIIIGLGVLWKEKQWL